MRKFLYFVFVGGFCCLGERSNSMNVSDWTTAQSPRDFASAVVNSRKHISAPAIDAKLPETEAEELMNKMLSDNTMLYYDKVAILWSAKHVFGTLMVAFAEKCSKQIEQIFAKKGEKFSNYSLGYALMRSQMANDSCKSLKKKADDGIISDAVSLLSKEMNGEQEKAQKFLSDIKSALQTEGFDFYD
jgi:hypothetical protein